MNNNKRKLLEWLRITIPALAGMLIMITLFNSASINIGAFTILVSLMPFQNGATILNIPPIGEIKAFTHWFFFQLNITLTSVDFDLLSQNAQGLSNFESWLDQLKLEARRGLLIFGARSTAISFIGGAIAVYLFCPSSYRNRFWKGGVVGALCFLLIVLCTLIIPFNLEAFNTPQYYGILSAAPWAMNFFDKGLSAVENLSDQLKTKAENLTYLFDHLEQFSPVEFTSSLNVLHVSDIHNNPAAIELITKVVHAFDIDLVIDTGDITDYGTRLEAELVSGVANLPVPYVFVPGNHDSPLVVEHLKNAGVIVLKDEVIEIMGLSIGGVTDPAYFSVENIITPKRQVYGRTLRPNFERESPLDILAVHDPIIAKELSDKANLFLVGHTHRPEVNTSNGNIMINAGTTGGSGIRGLNSPDDAPYTMFLLYFQEDDNGELSLTAGDQLSFPQLSGGFQLERFLFP